jgi:hypothetical protein
MSPLTHLMASWTIAAACTDNQRDRRLITLAGILPDIDRLGMGVDLVQNIFTHGENYFYYGEYHHWVFHGIFGAFLTSLLLSFFSENRVKVALLCLAVFHLHLVCDLVGSRGPSPADLWPIYYLGPFSRHGIWLWDRQWPLDGWQNRVISTGLFFWLLWKAVKGDKSIVSFFSRRADKTFIAVIHKWRDGRRE